jgi:hypothetical protein
MDTSRVAQNLRITNKRGEKILNGRKDDGEVVFERGTG